MCFGKLARAETAFYAFKSIVLAGENAMDVMDVTLRCHHVTRITFNSRFVSETS
ncbi:hypothetical protein X739_22820 [Mesorhizobium sp. LNHC220B00]|nr:hypothetical protein X739_22820 [Mesorhizobium sp. LNHC220B00]ESY96992.1 hypothetical protein X738_20205 [Mesorhizobium sp. LNHC209A00]